MSCDAFLAPTFLAPPHAREPRDALIVFVAHAHAVAEVADPMLAALLAGMLQGARFDGGRDWRGDRREGLELCRRLLLYVRQDVADRRLDVTLGYIAGELAAIGARPAAAH